MKWGLVDQMITSQLDDDHLKTKTYFCTTVYPSVFYVI